MASALSELEVRVVGGWLIRDYCTQSGESSGGSMPKVLGEPRGGGASQGPGE